jgi:hypothetical protein
MCLSCEHAAFRDLLCGADETRPAREEVSLLLSVAQEAVVGFIGTSARNRHLVDITPACAANRSRQAGLLQLL